MLSPVRSYGSCQRLQEELRDKACKKGARVNSLGKVVPPARFQRATSRLGGERSMQLSYGSTGEES